MDRLSPTSRPAYSAPRLSRAEVAELADAHGSGPCTRKGVGVRVPSSAPVTRFFIIQSSSIPANLHLWPFSVSPPSLRRPPVGVGTFHSRQKKSESLPVLQ